VRHCRSIEYLQLNHGFFRADYGGMDVYVNQIVGNGQPHDLFYTDTDVKVGLNNLVMEIFRS